LAFSEFLALSRQPGVQPYPHSGHLRHHYDPNQPRIPPGHPDGGQWTREGHGAASPQFGDQRVVSDAAPHTIWRSGAQYAQHHRRGGGGGPMPPTGGQWARLAVATAQARDAVRQVQERDPKWRPTPSLFETIEGRIAAAEAITREAKAHLVELMRHGIGPGPFARESIPARGPGRDFTPTERTETNRMGYAYGCHTCGTKNPGTRLGVFVPDHQPSNSVNRILGSRQRLYPQCKSCSSIQGSWLTHRWGRKR
jgi:hypothetical protein